MNKLNWLQMLGFLLQIFAFIALVMNLLIPSMTGSRLPFYGVFVLGVICLAIGNNIQKKK